MTYDREGLRYLLRTYMARFGGTTAPEKLLRRAGVSRADFELFLGTGEASDDTIERLEEAVK